MFLGKVVGTVWSTVKWPQLTGLKLLLVRPYNLSTLRQAGGHQADHGAADAETQPDTANPHEAVVCADLLDAGVGDDVIIAYGHAARVAAYQADTKAGTSVDPGTAPAIPIDAAVVAVVDNFHLSPELDP